MYKNKSIYNSGFNIIEILIILAILAIFVSLSITVFLNLSNNQSLEKEVTTSLSFIEKARMKTINSSFQSQYGVKLASTSVTIFPGTTYVQGNASNTAYTLGGKAYISSINLTNGGTSFYFQKLTGKPSATGTITFRLTGTTTEKYIIINSAGLAEVQ